MMQPNRRLVQHIEHAAQLRSDLCSQPNALTFAAGERRRRSVERNVAQPDGIQKLQALDNLVHDAAGDLLLAPGQLDSLAFSRARETGMAVKSAMDMPSTSTARLSGRRRLP